MRIRSILLFAAIIIGSNACIVPKKKYDAEVAKNKSLTDELNALKVKADSLQIALNNAKLKIEELEAQSRRLQADTTALLTKIEKTKKSLDEIKQSFDLLQKNNEILMDKNAKENLKLINELKAIRDDLNAKEKALAELQARLAKKEDNLNQLSNVLMSRQQRLEELEGIIKRQDSILYSVKAALEAALKAFENDGIKIELKNGLVYVSLEDQLLFKTGSTTVDARGQDALKKLSKVLESHKDFNVMIEGHTDNAPVLTGSAFKDNWDLSVLRATAVLRILGNSSNIDPQRLIPSGRGEFSPIALNTNKEGKAKNRRTEIIITPKLDELYKLMEVGK
jgi:chemotaxis protein MotB